ncbi:alpha/beta fold hydrolase BchO [Sphingomonas sp. CJ99]
MSGRHPDWEVDGQDWPNRTASRFVASGGYRWHVQRMGHGPVCLLLHGTGAATHSWRDLMPILAEHHDVVAIDLPGHGFTRSLSSHRPTLEGMAQAVGALLDTLGIVPDRIVGHSAGAAIGAQLVLDRGWRMPLIGLAPALMPFPGLAAKLFPQLATLLFTNPFVSIIFSRMAAAPGEAAKFLKRSTGSRIDADGERYYRRLFSKSGHCDGAIRMMANWRLEPLRDRLGELTGPVLLVHPANDAAIPASAVTAAAALIPGAQQTGLPKLGHLAHEEDPRGVAALITAFAPTGQSA